MPHFDEFIFKLEGSKSLMVEYLTGLTLVESEVESQGCDECCGTGEKHQEWVVTMSPGLERIITKLITVWFIVGVWLIDNQVSVRIWREDVLVTMKIRLMLR